MIKKAINRIIEGVIYNHKIHAYIMILIQNLIENEAIEKFSFLFRNFISTKKTRKNVN